MCWADNVWYTVRMFPLDFQYWRIPNVNHKLYLLGWIWTATIPLTLIHKKILFIDGCLKVQSYNSIVPPIQYIKQRRNTKELWQCPRQMFANEVCVVAVSKRWVPNFEFIIVSSMFTDKHISLIHLPTQLNVPSRVTMLIAMMLVVLMTDHLFDLSHELYGIRFLCWHSLSSFITSKWSNLCPILCYWISCLIELMTVWNI